MLVYDDSKPEDILKFAKRLEHRSIAETNSAMHTYKGKNLGHAGTISESRKGYSGKGKFGNALEEIYFGKKNDCISQPDFPKAGVELKTAPLKTLKNGQTRVKERLVLNIINYEDLDKEKDFESSHFLEKNALLLLIFYYHNKQLSPAQLKVDLVDIWECLKEDEAQIKKDWELIREKVRQGLADEISEGDTLFLGACTKGANKKSSMTTQPHSDKLARGRAFCFKNSYINRIYKTLKDRSQKQKTRFIQDSESDIEKLINSRYAPYLGKSVSEISKELGNISSKAKSKYAIIARSILGYKKSSDTFYEFEAANIQLKTIRVESNGKIKESMSFPAINYLEIIDEEWTDSDFYYQLTCKFIFVIFKKDKENGEYYLERIKYWNMPEKDLDKVGAIWKKSRDLIKEDQFDELPKLADKCIIHVRTHARNKKDTRPTPSGREETKRSFWLNNHYILKVINNEIG